MFQLRRAGCSKCGDLFFLIIISNLIQRQQRAWFVDTKIYFLSQNAATHQQRLGEIIMLINLTCAEFSTPLLPWVNASVKVVLLEKNPNIFSGNSEMHTGNIKCSGKNSAWDILSTWPIWCSSCPVDGNRLLPGVIWSDRGMTVAVWLDHANHVGKKKKHSLSNQIHVCLTIWHLCKMSVNLSMFRPFLAFNLRPSSTICFRITLVFKLCVEDELVYGCGFRGKQTVCVQSKYLP